MMMRGGAGGANSFRMQPGQGRVLLGLNYLHRFQDEIEVRPGLPVIDKLETSGMRRDELQGFARVFKDGNGAALTFNWRGESRIDGGTGGTDLTFEPYTVINLEFSTNLGQRPGLFAEDERQADGEGASLADFALDRDFAAEQLA